MRPPLPHAALALASLAFVAAPARAAPGFTVEVTADGAVKVAGREVPTDQLPVVAGALAAADPAARWTVVAAPGASSERVATVLAGLEQAEVGEVSVRMGTVMPASAVVRFGDGEPRPPAPPTPPQPGSGGGSGPHRPTPPTPPQPGASGGARLSAPVPIPVRPAPSPPIKLVGDQRTTFAVAQQMPSDGSKQPPVEAAFVLSRAALGAQAHLGDRATARALLNVFEKHSQRTIDTSDGASLTLEQYPSGWVARVRDAWVDVKLVEDGRLSLRSGLQEHIVGERGVLTNPATGYYVVDPSFQPIFELGGLLTSRELGIRGTAKLADDRAALDLMVSNGTGQAGEDNSGKDLSARVGGEVVESVHLYGSVLTGARGDDNEGRDLIYVAGAEFRSDHARLTGSYVGGSTDDGPGGVNGGDPVRFVGAEGSAWLGTDLAAESLDRGAFVARVGWFDPSPDEAYPDGWVLLQGALQLWLDTPDPHKLMVGVGVADLIPIDATAPVELRITGQTVWQF